MTGDPLPAPAMMEGHCQTAGAGHRLVYLRDERVLVWHPGDRHFRVWLIDRAATENADPQPRAAQTGVRARVGQRHELISLSGKRVLGWLPSQACATRSQP